MWEIKKALIKRNRSWFPLTKVKISLLYWNKQIKDAVVMMLMTVMLCGDGNGDGNG